MRSVTRGFALWLLLLLACALPAAAAPEVKHPRGGSGAFGYVPAANFLGADDWGNQDHSESTTHVILQGTRDAATLWIALPPDTPEEPAEAWLQELAGQLGWPHPQLSLYSRAGALILKVESDDAPRKLPGGRSELSLDLAPLTRGIGRLSRNPVLLAVRTPGADVHERAPEPYVAGSRRGDDFLFYRLHVEDGVLSVEYGVPPRWPAAALVSLLMWLLFPLLPALGVWRYVTSVENLQPDARLRFFDRCQTGARVAATAGFFVTLSVLQFERTRYFGFNPWGTLSPAIGLLMPYWFWAGGMIGLVRRKLSQEIARSALVVRTNPVLSFGYAVALLAMILGPGLVTSSVGPRAGVRATTVFTGAGMVLLGVLLLVVFLPRLTWKPKRLLDIPFDDVPQDPEALRAVLRERTEQTTREMNDPQPNPALAASQAKAIAASPVAKAAMGLAPDQLVALSASYHLALPQFRKITQRQSGLFVGSTLVMIAGGIWCCFHPAAGLAGFVLPASLFLVFACTTFANAAAQRRVTRCQALADQQVARALDEPRRLLDALRELEQAEIAMFAALGTGRPRATGFGERRKRLTQHLGLD